MTASPAVGNVPENAPEQCPGTASDAAGKSAACQGCPNQQACATAPKGPDPDLAAIADRLAGVKHKILILSGKGGVGKSTVAAQLAFALAAAGKEVGLLDIDICGPSVPKMLGLEGEEIHQSNLGWSPVYVEDNLAVMSIGFMLPNPDEAVIWRGPRKNGLIKQFLRDVDWGELDYLIVDAPPGTSDEHITIAQCLQASPSDGAIIVTTPQEVSIIDVRKEVNFCKKVGLPLLGVVENMSGLQQRVREVRFRGASGQPDGNEDGDASGDAEGASSSDATHLVQQAVEAMYPGLWRSLVVETDIFYAGAGGAARMCREMGVPLLGRLPMDPSLGRAAEQGRAVRREGDDPLCLPALNAIVDRVLAAKWQ